MKNAKCCIKCVPPKRYPGCHDRCPEFQAVVKENERERSEITKRNHASDDAYRVRQAKRDRYRRRAGGKR